MTIATGQTIAAADILAIQVAAEAALTGSPTAHGVLIGAGGVNVGQAGPAAAGQALISNGASADPAFRSLVHSDISDWISATAGFGAGSTGVTSVAGRTGAITLGSTDITNFASAAAAAAPVQSVAARTGSVTLSHTDITDWASATAGFGAGSTGVTSVAGRTGAITLGSTDITNFASAAAAAAPVQSVATRTGAITLSHADITDWTSATAGFGGGTQAVGSVSISAATANGSSLTVPANAVIIMALLTETAGHAVAASLGTTTGGADILAAVQVGASSLVPLPALSLLQAAFNTNQAIFVSSSAWNSASLNLKVWYVE